MLDTVKLMESEEQLHWKEESDEDEEKTKLNKMRWKCVYSGFLPPSKNMHVRLIVDSKIVLRSECERAWLFVSFVSVWPCDVQGVPRLSPDDRWDRLQPPRDPTDGLSGYRKWMNGWMLKLRTHWQDCSDTWLLKCLHSSVTKDQPFASSSLLTKHSKSGLLGFFLPSLLLASSHSCQLPSICFSC